jgi:hypothetical protein
MNRRIVALTAALLLGWSLSPAVDVVRAATPIISMTFTVDHPIAWSGTPVTFTGVITPVSGTPTNLGLRMGDYFASAGTCEPVLLCDASAPSHDPSWLIPTLSAPLTIKFHVGAPQASVTNSFYVTTDGVGCSGTCPPTVTMKRPTVTSSVTYSPSGIVMPGDTLHFVVGAVANVASPDGDFFESVAISSGLAPPTNVQAPIPSPSWNYNAGILAGYVPPFLTTRVVWVSFDSVVTGAIGTDVTVHGQNLDGLGSYTLVNRTLTVHVGPLPTPTPKPTPKPTARPSGTAILPGSSPAPVATAAASASDNASGSPGASISSSAEPSDASGPTSGATAEPGSTTLETVPAGVEPVPASTNAAGPNLIGVLGLALALGAIVFGGLWFRRSRR